MTAAPGSNSHQDITLLQERSAGTFARVYLAEAHTPDGLSRIVAVKVLKTQWSQDPQLLSRTQDEARLLARLHHRNILRVEGLAELNGHPAIIMEFVDGIDLKQLIEKSEALPPRAAYRIARDTAAALEAAFFRAPYGRSEPMHVVHRDIKPSNIMVSVEGDVKVLDFGTARYQNEVRLAQTGALRFGSLKYMSPERRAGDRGEHSSDIYALGVVLIEMLRGELLPVIPLEQDEHDPFIQQQVDRLPALGLPNAEWEESLKQTICRMCAHQPDHRLDAQQTVQLMRHFADQAQGASLDSYSADVITHLTRQIYPSDRPGKGSGA
ncbi:MAG: serine/threonine-protein kinase, partial [Myxococcota bacterium]